MSKQDVYVLYLRKSRADMEAEKLGEMETLKRHEEILTALAARQGLFIGKVYKELVSGETIAARPEIQKVIKECYEGKYRGIIIIDVDRLSRGNQADMQTIMDCLKYSNNREGLLVVTPTKTYDVAHNPDDEEYMEFVLFMSRREYKTIQKRLERGRRQAVVEGQFMGSYRPYGYDIKKTKLNRTLEQNPEEAPVVKDIFEWTVEKQMTPGEIARKLTALHVPTYSGDPEWSLATIKTILQNPTYKGKVRWNDRMVVKTMNDGKLTKSRPRSNHTRHYMEYDGLHKAIVSEELWNEAQKNFRHDKTKANQTLQNPLAGLIVCAKCQKAMVYSGYKHKTNVAPRILHKQSQLCKVKSAFMSDVMDAFVHGLKLYLEDYELKIDNQTIVDEDDIERQILALGKEKKATERKLSKIFDDYEEGIYTPNEFITRKAKHNDRLEVIEAQIHELESSIPEKTEYEEKIMYLSDAIDMLKDASIDAETKNDFLKSFIDRIEFSRDNNDEFNLDIYLQ
ncbi:recombinase family protein [Bacillus infantis]|uniref:recombinase family protein n=1 Tax=Bacillus infantis TaxID=324767 RepID=UPI003CF62417